MEKAKASKPQQHFDIADNDRINNVKVLSYPLLMFKLSYADICFKNLTQLLAEYCGEDLSRLPKILTKLPNLEVLTLNKIRYCNHTITCETWKQEQSEISCLKFSLKRLQLGKFDAEGVIQMLEYFLENARVLNEIRLVVGSWWISLTFYRGQQFAVLPESYGEEMVQIMQRRNVQYLTKISCTLLEALVGTSNSKLRCCDNNLTKLVMRCCGADLKVFPDILKFLPNLEVLVLDLYKNCSCTIQFEVLEEETAEISCLKYSLKKVELRSFKGTGAEMQAVEYFLKNARVLAEIRLRGGEGSEVEAEVLKKLLMFTRRSDTCQIVVS